jgi:cellulose biosynthesis protein BcsQ
LGLNVSDVNLADIYEDPKNLEVHLQNSLREVFIENIHCITGSKRLENVHPTKNVLKKALSSGVIKKLKYDYCIIDNSPSMSAKTIAAVNASDVFLIPVELSQFAMDGLKEIMETLTKEYSIEEERIIIARNRLKATKIKKAAAQAVKIMYPDNTLKTIIPEDELFNNMVMEEKSMFLTKSLESKKVCKGLIHFHQLISEIFGFDEEEMFKVLIETRKKYLNNIRLKNLKRARI